MDIVAPEIRSRMMSGIRGKNTRPEIQVRKMVHALGLRFRLHDGQLPGRPDLVLRKHGIVIFVHGCFWHRHDCRFAAMPKTRPEFWNAKFKANVERDRRNRAALVELGWKVIEVWECELRAPEKLTIRLCKIFGVPGPATLGSGRGTPKRADAVKVN